MNILKGTYSILIASMLLVIGAQMHAAETNLLTNGGFETYSYSALGYSFEDWSLPLGVGQPYSDDKLEGTVSLKVKPLNVYSVLDNSVSLPDFYYAPGTEFTIRIYFKILSLQENSALSLDCYWEPEPGGDSEAMKMHDANVLQQVVSDAVSSDWEYVEVVTTKPEASTRLRIRVSIPKQSIILFDAFSVVGATEKPGDPYIHIAPIKVDPVETNLGNSVNFTTIHVEQGELTGTTTFELSGYNKEMFRLSATSMPSDQSAMDLVITYMPTTSGTHTAILNIDNLNHTSLFQSVQLKGTCIDPSKEPSITVTPTTLPKFEAVVGQDKRENIIITSENCYNYVYMRVDHIQGAAFTIDGSMMGKNDTYEIQARFAPLEPGEYQSTVTVYSEGVDTIVLTLNGTGIERSEENIDWQTGFVWNESNPMKLMNVTFDDINHNKTLVLDGWQNVAPLEERPWWGFDEAKTSPIRGNDRYAKATAYQYGKSSTEDWETTLVTPPLDYKNAEGKTFVFSIMGEYMPDVDNPALLEIYYIDATGETAYFQNLTESFTFPTTSDENNVWCTYFLDLAPYEETMADVFHMAFRYACPNGSEGAVTYYLDDISWGRTDLPVITANLTSIIDSTAVIGQTKVLGDIEVTSKNLTNAITLSVAGSNYNRFDLSTTSLPAEGGTFTVSFTGQEVGVHEAYVVISSKGAADVFIPMAVLCNRTQGIEEAQRADVRREKILINGQIVIIRGDKKYTLLGIETQ